MAYVKQVWENLPSTATPLRARFSISSRSAVAEAPYL